MGHDDNGIKVKSCAPIVFETAEFPVVGDPAPGIAYDGAGKFTVYQSGDYLIMFGISTRDSNENFALTVNDNVVTGTELSTSQGTSMTGESIILCLHANDTVKVINNNQKDQCNCPATCAPCNYVDMTGGGGNGGNCDLYLKSSNKCPGHGVVAYITIKKLC
jgi:hypothetical protein